jgi:Na+-transporting methylmalonyl-CoA/oxaloacetate decarboxylase gamma subunit
MMKAMRKRIGVFCLPSQEGAALVIAVLILLVLTVIGIYAVSTSTFETRIAGNERVLKDAFYAADGGIDYGRRVISLILNNQSLPTGPTGANPDDEDKLNKEIRGFEVIDEPDRYVHPEIGNSSMDINLDRIKVEEPPGASHEFGGVVSEKQTSIYYRIDSTSTGLANASSEVEATYRHVIHE